MHDSIRILGYVLGYVIGSLIVATAAAATVVVREIPGIARYLKITRM